MHYGSSKEEACSEEEARAQDRRGEEDDGEEDGHRPSQDRSQEITGEGAGATGSRACPSPKGEATASKYRRYPKALGLPLGLAFRGFEPLLGDQLGERAAHAVERR
jgi:hypothetical protein